MCGCTIKVKKVEAHLIESCPKNVTEERLQKLANRNKWKTNLGAKLIGSEKTKPQMTEEDYRIEVSKRYLYKY
jgi:hypothetical protein